jgi:hypothetical protein
MLFRVGAGHLLWPSAVVVANCRGGTLEVLASPFARFGFALIALDLRASLAYALMFTRVRDPIRFAYWQIGIDLMLTTLVVVHATGGSAERFCFLYLIDVVAVALLARRRGAALVADGGHRPDGGGLGRWDGRVMPRRARTLDRALGHLAGRAGRKLDLEHRGA